MATAATVWQVETCLACRHFAAWAQNHRPTVPRPAWCKGQRDSTLGQWTSGAQTDVRPKRLRSMRMTS